MCFNDVFNFNRRINFFSDFDIETAKFDVVVMFYIVFFTFGTTCTNYNPGDFNSVGCFATHIFFVQSASFR